MKDKNKNKGKINPDTIFIITSVIVIFSTMATSIIAIIKDYNFNAIWFLFLSVVWAFLLGETVQRRIYQKAQEKAKQEFENFIKELNLVQTPQEKTEPFEEFK